MSDECYKCKAAINWDAITWDYFEVLGYRTKVFKCVCGNTPSRHEPFSKEKKAFWLQLKDWMTGDL